MDAKEKWLVHNLGRRISAGNFGELDVLSLFMLLRRHAEKESPTREIGDFVAHRERDRGVLLKYIQAVRLALNGEGPAVPVPVWTVEQTQSDVNALLHKFGVQPFDRETANQLLVCVITLLQSVHVESPSPISYLAVGLSSYYVALFGHGKFGERWIFQFPLLIAENNGYEYSLEQHKVAHFFRADRVMEAFSENGVFKIEQRSSVV